MIYKPTKNWLVTLLLSVFLGTLGIDRFYLGHIGLGIAKLLLSWMTFGLWQILDIILIAMRAVNSSHFYWDDSAEAYAQSAPRGGYPQPGYPQQNYSQQFPTPPQQGGFNSK